MDIIIKLLDLLIDQVRAEQRATLNAMNRAEPETSEYVEAVIREDVLLDALEDLKRARGNLSSL